MIRNGISFGIFSSIAKNIFVQAAKDEIEENEKRASLSKISILTGVPRKDIKKCLEAELETMQHQPYETQRGARVLTAWVSDPNYIDTETKKPIDLPLKSSKGPSLEFLIKKYSGGIPTKAMVDELVRLGTITELEEGLFRLLSFQYQPDIDEVNTFERASQDVSDLMQTIQHNILNPKEKSFVQLSAQCDNLPEEAMVKLEKVASQKGFDLLKDMAQHFSQYDRDQNEAVFGTGRKRAKLGLFYYEEDFTGEKPDEKT